MSLKFYKTECFSLFFYVNSQCLKRLSAVSLYINESKTEYERESLSAQPSGFTLKKVDDYKYLGSYNSSSDKDFKIRKVAA